MGKAPHLLVVSPYLKASFKLLEAMTTPQEKLLSHSERRKRIGGGDIWIHADVHQ